MICTTRHYFHYFDKVDGEIRRCELSSEVSVLLGTKLSDFFHACSLLEKEHSVVFKSAKFDFYSQFRAFFIFIPEILS